MNNKKRLKSTKSKASCLRNSTMTKQENSKKIKTPNQVDSVEPCLKSIITDALEKEFDCIIIKK